MTHFAFVPVPRCILCQEERRYPAGVVAWHEDVFRYVLCAGCGLKYMDPVPPREFYDHYYQAQFWQTKLDGRGFGIIEGTRDERDQQGVRAVKRRRRIVDVESMLRGASLPPTGWRMLEVGCSLGTTLEHFQNEHGCEIFGIEPSDSMRPQAEQRGVRLVGRYAEELADQTIMETFDLILFLHSLENSTQPIAVLQGARRHLNPGGRLLVITPNVDYYDCMNPYHPYIYSPESLQRLLAQGGFDPLYEEHSSPPSVGVTHPLLELRVIAAPGTPPPPPLRPQDPTALLARHALGQRVMALNSFGNGTLLRLLWARLGNRIIPGSGRAKWRRMTRRP